MPSQPGISDFTAQPLKGLVHAVAVKEVMCIGAFAQRDWFGALLLLCTQLLERSIDMVRRYGNAAFGALGLGAKLSAQAIEIKLAVLEVGIGLKLRPV